MSDKRLDTETYFLTVRTANGLHLFGEIVDGEMICNPADDLTRIRHYIHENPARWHKK